MHFDQSSRRILAGACVVAGVLGILLVLAGVTFAGVPVIVVALALGAFGWLIDTGEPTGSADTEELVARMSHELRTPLTSVIGMLDLLDSDQGTLEAEEAAELLGLARSEAEHIEHLVANLHSASRLARNTLEPSPVPINIARLTSRVVDRFPSVARRTYLPTGRLLAMADPQLTTQVITNLVQNVERYAPDGEVTITVERRDDYVALVLSDDGPGIDREEEAAIFSDSASDRGLGIGLTLSRELAEAMGGDLAIERSRRRGATFALLLPHTDEALASPTEHLPKHAAPVIAHSPRARLLVDLAAAFAERSLDRTMAGIHRLYVELLGATGTVLMVPEGEAFQPVASSASAPSQWVVDATLTHVLRTASPVELSGLAEPGVPDWQRHLGGRAALAVPVMDGTEPVGVLVVSFAHANDIPAGRAGHVAMALAQLAAFAVHRASLARDVAFERTLRSSVMESLPIAISVFAGDPPTVVDWNQRERDMLGLSDDVVRPSDLHSSQSMFRVRFADGTPLTVDNAPVTAAIRSGQTAGPFLLTVQRADGTDITTRTYCAPFFDEDGTVAGAVVTSEELGITRPGSPHSTDLAGTPGS
ncbi:MAG: ATP-binding protein [Acidimicrobiia bacterium]|nr:ATP-binding protein [Acidimicrobiia bacterium]